MTDNANYVPSDCKAGVMSAVASGFYMRVRGLVTQLEPGDNPQPHTCDPQWCREVVARPILGPLTAAGGSGVAAVLPAATGPVPSR